VSEEHGKCGNSLTIKLAPGGECKRLAHREQWLMNIALLDIGNHAMVI
jgi:hypothetical protein